jgi:hypothetical protein
MPELFTDAELPPLEGSEGFGFLDDLVEIRQIMERATTIEEVEEAFGSSNGVLRHLLYEAHSDAEDAF